MKIASIETPLGLMVVVADNKAIYRVTFIDHYERYAVRLKRSMHGENMPGRTQPMELLEQDIHAYFAGTLLDFKTPMAFMGTPFQQAVWAVLRDIPYGDTRSYADIARAINKPAAVRAVANAIGANPLWIMVPCHRVINTSGALGGYAGGIERKQWLLEHEKRYLSTLL